MTKTFLQSSFCLRTQLSHGIKHGLYFGLYLFRSNDVFASFYFEHAVLTKRSIIKRVVCCQSSFCPLNRLTGSQSCGQKRKKILKINITNDEVILVVPLASPIFWIIRIFPLKPTCSLWAVTCLQCSICFPCFELEPWYKCYTNK